MKKTILPLLCFFIFSIPILGQVQEKEYLAVKAYEHIQIDGQLNESIWEKAPDAGVYIQPEPNRTDPQKIKTSVKILFDDDYLYIGFLCYDTEPENIVAGAVENDGDLRDTDSIYILIDILQESKAFLYFATNVAGIRSDGMIPKGGRSVDYRWNGIWQSSSRKTEFGWSAEVAIERSALSIEPAQSKSLGLSIARVVPRLEYNIFLPNPLEPAFRVSELRELRVLELLTAEEQIELEKGAAALLLPEKRIVIIPYGITELEAGEKISPGVGMDVRYSFSQQMSGWLTAFPDFATVEPDHEQVNLTPFELYLPERRDFFRGTSNIYQQPFGLFYSKRIGDIYGGVKLNGQFETYEFSLISAQTIKDENLDLDSANFSALSFKRTNQTNSFSIGVTAANKLIGGKNKGTAGIEAQLNLTDKLRVAGQFALSYGDYGKKNTAFFIGPSYDSANFHIHLHYKQIDENFGDNANIVGFIPDDNRRELDSAINKTFPLNFGPLMQLRYVSNYNIYWGMDGTLRSWQIDEGLFLDLRERRFSFSVVHTMEYKLNEYILEPKRIYISDQGGWLNLYTYDFRNDRTMICSEFYNGEWQQFSLSVTFGKNYGSQFFMFTISKKMEITKNLFSEYYLYRIRYQTESLYNSAFIHVLNVTLIANEKLYWKFFFQSNSDISKSNFHVVCAYTFKPPYGTIQLTYQKGTGMFGEKGIQAHTIFLKIGYMF
jgi:hypothetical protein